mmetsp:Transcript_868/g.1495  ORF Transcript_868/g.1495 Transcript_868/m.1495 type:complete len:355 (-) Transcript_868:3-1067(-)
MSETVKVCVTGATGFLGSWVVKEALDAGFEVHGTTRSEAKTNFLQNLDGAAERLKMFSGCDLTKKGSFDAAIEGCKIVIHTASPFFMNHDDSGRAKLVEPALEGTRTVLEACAAKGVERVVLTSSTAAVYMAYGTKPLEEAFSEEDWSDADVLEEKKNFYCLSKVLAERLAWELAAKDDCPFKLSVMNPCLIFGPMLPGQTHLNTSCNTIIGYFSAPKIKQQSIAVVDVRDVARAHVIAARQDLDWAGWGQRNVLVGAVPMIAEVMQVLKESDKVSDERKAKLPTEVDEDIPPAGAGHPPPNRTKMNISQSEKPVSDGGLGLKYYSLKDMVEATYQSLVDNDLDDIEKYTLVKE